MIENYINKIINADCMDVLKKLPDRCIDLILTDPPYGTTAIACQNLNRKFICVEKDHDYWKASCKRLEDHQRQGILF